MSIKTRIQTFTTLLLFVMIIIIQIGIFFIFKHLLYTDNQEKTKQKIDQVAEALTTIPVSGNLEAFFRAYVPSNGMIRVIAEDEKSIFISTKEENYANIPIFYTNQDANKVIAFQKDTFSIASTPIVWHDGSIVSLEMAENMSSTEEILDALRLVLVVASCIVMLPIYFAGRFLSAFFLNPIKALISTMETIQNKGSFEQIKLEGKKKDELYQLGNTFNRMISILERQFQQQKQFVSDASHELRTPLTIIEGYANMLKRWGMTRQDVLHESIDAIHSEAIRMKEMTNQMLELAKASGRHNQKMEVVNLLDICKDVTRKMEIVNARIIAIECPKDTYFMEGNIQLLKQLIYILLDNGFKYGANKMRMVLQEKDNVIMLKMEDNGDGISEEHLPNIFDRFYRIDKARSREVDGSGLGLSIAKGIMEMHEGTIEAISTVGIGTTFICTFPVYEGD